MLGSGALQKSVFMQPVVAEITMHGKEIVPDMKAVSGPVLCCYFGLFLASPRRWNGAIFWSAGITVRTVGC